MPEAEDVASPRPGRGLGTVLGPASGLASDSAQTNTQLIGNV